MTIDWSAQRATTLAHALGTFLETQSAHYTREEIITALRTALGVEVALAASTVLDQQPEQQPMATEPNAASLLLPLTWQEVRDIDTALRERVYANADSDEYDFLARLLGVVRKLEPLYKAGAADLERRVQQLEQQQP